MRMLHPSPLIVLLTLSLLCGTLLPPYVQPLVAEAAEDSLLTMGDGRDGIMPSDGNLDSTNGVGIGTIQGTAGASSVEVINRRSVERINPGDLVLLHQSRGPDAGNWELNHASSDLTGDGTLLLAEPLRYTYTSNGGSEHAQIVRVPQYSSCDVTGTIRPLLAWNGEVGGILAIACSGTLQVRGTIINSGGNGATLSDGNPAGGSGAGFRGGQGDAVNSDNYGCGDAGEGTRGETDCNNHLPNGSGGAAGTGRPETGAIGSGGGGGNGTIGGTSTVGGQGVGGEAAGIADLQKMVFGGGGGGSNANPGTSVGGGGAGGGIIVLLAKETIIDGSIQAQGGQGGGNQVGGGSGAGGSILIRSERLTVRPNSIIALGGAAQSGGGAGGDGRIRIESCEDQPNPNLSSPSASTAQIVCVPPRLAEQALNITSAVANAEPIPLMLRGEYLHEPISVQIDDKPLQATLENSRTLHVVLPVADLGLAVGRHRMTVTSVGVTREVPGGFTVLPPVDPSLLRVAAYMSCDNLLENDCRQAFNELEQMVANNPQLRVLAFWDGQRDGDSAYFQIQPDTNPYQEAKYTDGENRFPLGEVDAGNPATLATFLGWTQSRYPGQYKLLSLIGHGGGWAPDLYPSQPRSRHMKGNEDIGGMLWDDRPGSTMATTELAQALRWNSRAYRLDVLYLDACLMGSVEVLAEIGTSTHTVVSHESVTWASYPYGDYLAGINSIATPTQLATWIAERNAESWPLVGHPDQVAMIQTAALSETLTALDELAAAMLATLPNTRPAIAEAALGATRVDSNGDWLINEHDSVIDLRDFTAQLRANPALPAEVHQATDKLSATLSKTVLWNKSQNGQPWQGRLSQSWNLERLAGLSIYFPLTDEWKRPYYGSAALPKLAATTHWDEFIQAWYEGQQAPPPPADLCDDCPFAPVRIGLILDPPERVALGGIAEVPVLLEGAVLSDNLRSLLFTVVVSDPTILVPSDRDAKWDPLAGLKPNLLASHKSERGIVRYSSATPISGNRVLLRLPYYARRAGCTMLRIELSQLVDGRLRLLRHQRVPGWICVNERTTPSAGPRGNLTGNIFLQGRLSGTYGEVEVKLKGNVGYSALTDANGTYTFTNILAGSYRLEVRRDGYVVAQRQIEVRPDITTNVPEIGLWAGDFDNNGEVTLRDWQICAEASLPEDNRRRDLTGDNITDGRDFTLIQANIGRSPSQMRTTNPPTDNFGSLFP